MAKIEIDVKALVSDAVKNLDTLNDTIGEQEALTNKLAKAQHDLESASLKLSDAQKRLASNTDPERQHDLEGAVLAARVALDRQGDEVNDLAREYKGLGSQTDQLEEKQGGLVQSLVDIKAGWDMAQQGLQYLQQGYDATIAKAAEWGDSMGDLASLTGQSVEETSRLAATMELVGIDASSLGRIMKSMNKEGLNLNLETLLKLNKQYNELQDPVEKNTFLFRNFGKAAEDMAEVMGRSEKELRALADTADKSGKVIDEAFANKAEIWNTQLEILGQQAEGAGIQIGGTLMDATLAWFRAADDATQGGYDFIRMIPGIGDAYAAIREPWEDFIGAFDEVRTKAPESAEAVEGAAVSATDAWTQRWRGVADEALAAKALQDTKNAAADLRNELAILTAALGGDISNELDDFYQKQKDAGIAVTETKDKIAELEKKHYLTADQKAELEDLKKTLEDQMGVLEENRKTHEETTARIIFSMLQQQYAVDGLSTDEIAALTKIGLGLGIYDQATADAMTSAQQSIAEHGTDAQAILNDLYNKYTELQQAPDIVKNVTVKYQKVGDENFGGWTPPAGGGTPAPSTPAPSEPLDPGMTQSIEGGQSMASTGGSGVYIAPGAVVISTGATNVQELASIIENTLAERLRLAIQAGV